MKKLLLLFFLNISILFAQENEPYILRFHYMEVSSGQNEFINANKTYFKKLAEQAVKDKKSKANEAQEGQAGTMALFVSDQDGGEHEVEVEVEIKNGKPEINPKSLPGPEDQLYWDDADIEQQAMDAMKNGDIEFDEGNAYAHAVKKAKMNGKKKGDEIDGPDGDKIKLEKDEKTPLGEFILSYFDYTTGQFPKGETAILTMVEKDYGEQYIEPAKQFLEKINNRVSEVMGYREEPVVQDNTELDSIRSLAGI